MVLCSNVLWQHHISLNEFQNFQCDGLQKGLDQIKPEFYKLTMIIYEVEDRLLVSFTLSSMTAER